MQFRFWPTLLHDTRPETIVFRTRIRWIVHTTHCHTHCENGHGHRWNHSFVDVIVVSTFFSLLFRSVRTSYFRHSHFIRKFLYFFFDRVYVCEWVWVCLCVEILCAKRTPEYGRIHTYTSRLCQRRLRSFDVCPIYVFYSAIYIWRSMHSHKLRMFTLTT